MRLERMVRKARRAHLRERRCMAVAGEFEA